MRKLLPILLLLAACKQAPETKTETPDIAQFEKNLVGEVYFEGDSTWTIEERMKHYGVPGASIAVIKDNKILWSKAYGIMDKETNEPVTTETLFQAGSISKPVAAYGALKAAESGKVDLEKNVNDYLTSWKIPDNEFTKDKKVTLAQLLSHTGGLTVHGFGGYTPGDAVPTTIQVLNGEKPANSPEVRVDKIPGASFRYSGGGYTIMQLMMGDLYGKPYPDVEKELVLDPLEMNNSTYDQPLDSIKIKKAATGYLPNHEQASGKRHTYPEMAAAGLWTTAEDLAKFAIDIQKTYKGESTKVLSKNMVDKMLTPYVAEFIGLGIFIDKKSDDDVYFQHGGWDEGFSSSMWAHKTKGYGVVVLTNSNHPAFIDEVIRSVAHTYQWDNYVKKLTSSPIAASDIEKFTGRYKVGSDQVVNIYGRDGRLLYKHIHGNEHELRKFNDSTYTRDDYFSPFLFSETAGKKYLIPVGGGKRGDGYPAVTAEEKIPSEYLIEGDFKKAMKGYEAIRKANPNDDDINEQFLNERGYELMNDNKLELAKAVFRVNVELYPKSANVYDSYAEACLKTGDKKEAIKNYKKALELNPANEGAKKALKDLGDN